jgi:hypothetical protein
MPDNGPRLIGESYFWDRDLDNLFAESGRQAHVVWRLDGSFGGLRAVSTEIVNPPGGGTEGIWAEPLRLADYVHLHVSDTVGGVQPVERSAKRHSRRLGRTEITYELGAIPWLKIRKTVWVPRERPAVCLEIELRNQGDTSRTPRLFVEIRTHLGIGWPLRLGGRNTAAWDAASCALIAHDEGHAEWTAVCAPSRAPEAWHLGDFTPDLIGHGALSSSEGGTGAPGPGCSCLQFAVTIAAGGTETLRLVVCGSPRSEEEARDVGRDVLARWETLREEKAEHYRQLFDGSTILQSPSYVMDKAFLWAKVGTEDFKHFDPRLGLLFFAGFPAYNFYFASDTMLILRGSLAWGDVEDTRTMLRTIVRYQATEAGRDTRPGEIWHEMSTTGDRISPNFAGFLFPGLLRAVWDWTADRAFLEEMFPAVQALIRWGYAMDVNGDGLLENGPEGEMADSAHEDRNVERSHFGVQVQWLDALREAAGLARVLGHDEDAARWSGTFETLRVLVDRLYWNESQRYFEETLRPDGCLDTSGKGHANLDAGIVQEGKAALTARLLLEEEAYLDDAAAFAARQDFEATFRTHRSYMSWYVLERGRRALALFRARHSVPAFHALEQVAGTPFHWTTPGLWPEVWAVDEPTFLRVRGCFHQAWTGSHGYVYPVVHGLLGISPDAPMRTLSFVPRLPSRWPGARLHKLRLGPGWCDVACEQREGWRKLTVRNSSDQALTVKLGFVLPLDAQPVSLHVDGNARSLDELRPDLSAHEAVVEVTVVAAPGAEAGADVGWEGSGLQVVLDGESAGSTQPSGPVTLARTRPGQASALSLVVRNRSFRKQRVSLEVDAGTGLSIRPAKRTVTVRPGTEQATSFSFVVSPSAAEGYETLRVRAVAAGPWPLQRTVHVPVFRALAPSVDAREVAREGRAYTVRAVLVSLSDKPVTVSVMARWPDGMEAGEAAEQEAVIAPGARAEVMLTGMPRKPGAHSIRVEITCRDTGERWSLTHDVRVIAREKPLVLYSGFLKCPVVSSSEWEVVNLPANYAVRKPHVFDELLGLADLVLTSDQHDAVFSETQVRSLTQFVENGGRLFFFCQWSAPWGRGFHETFGNFAESRLPDLLPLAMRKGIEHARTVSLSPAGRAVFAGIDWASIPAFDHNAAEVRDGATLLATAESGAPLAARWDRGTGHVLAVAIDCFGFESYVEGLSFDFWPGKPLLIAAGIRALLGAAEPVDHGGNGR